MPKTRVDIEIKYPVNAYELFSLPKNLDVYIDVIVAGITDKLKIGIKLSDSSYSGNSIRIKIGAKNTPKIAKTTEPAIVKLLNFLVDLPLAS